MIFWTKATAKVRSRLWLKGFLSGYHWSFQLKSWAPLQKHCLPLGPKEQCPEKGCWGACVARRTDLTRYAWVMFFYQFSPLLRYLCQYSIALALFIRFIVNPAPLERCFGNL